MNLTVVTTYLLPQDEEGREFAKGLKEKNKDHISKYKESTTGILVETTYRLSVDMEGE